MEKRGARQIELKRSHGGVFNVYVNGQMKFSRHETGRYPLPDDIDALMRG